LAPLSTSFLLGNAILAFLGLFLFGCDIPPPSNPSSSTNGDSALLMPFQGPIRGMFDDGIDAEVFGATDDRSGAKDPKLSDRVRASDLVVVVQVTTVTEEGERQTGRLDLEFQPVDGVIRGTLSNLLQGNETLHVPMKPGTASYSLVMTNQSDLIGKRLILCAGRFLENGAPVMHWHGMADSPNIRTTVVAAASVADLEK